MISFSDEKKKTKSIDSEVNPVWNEVTLRYKNTQSHGRTCRYLINLDQVLRKAEIIDSLQDNPYHMVSYHMTVTVCIDHVN